MFKNVTLLLCSSRAYEDFIPGFLKLFKKYFSSFNGSIKVNITNCKYLDGIKLIKNEDFSSRTLQALKEIKTDYVFLMFEDYYLQNAINSDFVSDALNQIKQNNVGRVIFCDRNETYLMGKKNVSEFFVECYKHAPFIISAQPSLWKKKFLKQCLRKGETPWQFESYGSYRQHHSKKWKVYYPKEEYHVSAFPYPIGGIYAQGKLTEEGKALLLRENIKEPIVNNEKRDVYKKSKIQRLFDTNIYGHMYIRLSRVFRFIKCRSQCLIMYTIKDNWKLRDKNLYQTISK